MINFNLFDFLVAYRLLIQERDAAAEKRGQLIDKSDGDLLRNLKFSKRQIIRFASGELYKRMQICVALPEADTAPYDTLAYELSHVISLIEDGAKLEGFFHYRFDDGDRLKDLNREWSKTLGAFEDSRDYVEAALDNYAMGHYDGCVFYLVRLAELGLRSLAAERGVKLARDKPIEYANWQEVITAVDKNAKAVGQTAPAGKMKDIALAFYSGALADLIAIKDKYRNRVSHVRRNFGPDEALEAIEITRRLMNGLSDKLYDDTKTPIKWKF